MKRFILVFAAAVICAAACSGPGARLSDYNIKVYSPQYASGFEILGADGMQSTLLKVVSPWQEASRRTEPKYVLIRRNGETIPKNFKGSVIEDRALRIVCMSSSYVAMLNVLGVANRVVGVSGVDFLFNDTERAIAEVGYDQNTDYETIVSLRPDMVLLYGITGPSPLEEKLKTLELPYAYLGEYLEDNPLAKAEWIVALGEMVGMREHAEEIFSQIPGRYNAVKEKIAHFACSRPKVMLNTPYGDSWFMPGKGSYMVRLIEDACGEYVFRADSTNRSLPVSMELAVSMISEADYWLNAYAPSLDELKARYPKCADARCIEQGNVYNNDSRTNSFGGNDFWESGVMMPDVILYDLGVILHPGFGSELYFYRKLK